MVWWGHPITTGAYESDHLSIDYFLSLDVEVKDAAIFYQEQLVRIEHINTGVFAKVATYVACSLVLKFSISTVKQRTNS